MRSLSVKTKIALVVTVVTVAVVSAVLVLMLGAVDRANDESIESKLYAASASVESSLVVDDGVLLSQDEDVFVNKGTFSAVYDGKGHFLCGHMPTAKLDKIEFEEGELHRYQSWAVLDVSVDVSGYGKVYVRSVADAKTTAGFVALLKKLAAVALICTALLVVIVVMLVLRRFFRPVERMTQTAQRIASGTDLSERIELGKSKDEFYRLGVSFNEMMDRLEDSFEKERRFSSNASHELRTPISVILSESEMALGEERTRQEREESLLKIHAQAAHMSALVNQLLMLARADRGDVSISMEDVDLSELMELVCETASELGAEKNIAVRADIQPDVHVMGDTGLLMRMVLNLLENAVRYGVQDGHIEVSLTVGEGEAVGVVADDGIGIAKEDLPHIWERFYQADSARSGVDRGSGLGLSMVVFAVKSHSGSIDCTSDLGEGSTFSFRFPLAQGASLTAL